tara:strand:+ start:2000 stop:3088 length:1089 start_codon:yes stop_codon:yes gene_type:complete
MTTLKGMSLFSGMGGDTLGMINAGVDVIAYNEKEKVFCETHKMNFEDCKLIGENGKSNISNIPDSEFLKYKDLIDILFAGFPCQSFSTGGKRKVDDPRNTLFREFVRVAELTNAKIIIGENVKGLLTKKTETGELYINIIVSEFEKLGYSVKFQVLQCHKYGVPQKRERLVIIGIKNEHLDKYNLEFPEEDTPRKENWQNLRNIVNFTMEGTMKIDKKVFDFEKIPEECIIKNMKNKQLAKGAHPYLVMKKNIENKTYAEKSYETLFSFGKRDSPIHCEVIDIRQPSKTIICTYDHQPRFFVPIKNHHGEYLRMLTPDELKQIQGFPKDYKLGGNQKQQIIQIGNAVPPILIEKIVQTIINK